MIAFWNGSDVYPCFVAIFWNNNRQHILVVHQEISDEQFLERFRVYFWHLKQELLGVSTNKCEKGRTESALALVLAKLG